MENSNKHTTKVSFDFDGTIGETRIQNLAELIIKSSVYAEVHIISAREVDQRKDIPDESGMNKDVYAVAKSLGIPKENIHLTNGSYKYTKINELGINIHFDDVPEEVALINRFSPQCQGMLLWDEYCRGSIVQENFGKGDY